MTRDLMTGHLDDYRCSAEVRGSFQETAPRKTAENTVKHRDGGAGSALASHRGGNESLMVITTLIQTFEPSILLSKYEPNVRATTKEVV